MARVLFIVAQHDFRDEELFEPQAVLEAAGHTVTVASTAKGVCTGVRGGATRAELALAAVDPGKFEAVVVVGGPGARQLFGDEAAQHLVRELNSAGKPVAAICVAPMVLANAGVLRGRRATVFSSERQGLEAAGALLQREGVVTDGTIVTASGPDQAHAFGEALARVLKSAKRPWAHTLHAPH